MMGVLFSLFFAGMMCFAVPAVAQESPASLIVALDHGDFSARTLEAASRLPPGSLETRTINALARELSRLTETLIAQQDRPGNAEPLGDSWFEYHRPLAETLAHQRNPAAIEALVGAIVNRGDVYSALVDFGEQAVPRLVSCARLNVGLVSHVHVCLDALEQMLERPAIAKTLSTQSLQIIGVVASERMANPNGYPTTLASAAYLAIATRSQTLRTQAVEILDNPQALQSRGITDPRALRWVFESIREALVKFPLQQ